MPDDPHPLATEVGDDIYLDPPVRLLPQYDSRWAQERIAQDWTNAELGRERVQCVDGRHDSPLVRGGLYGGNHPVPN